MVCNRFSPCETSLLVVGYRVASYPKGMHGLPEATSTKKIISSDDDMLLLKFAQAKVLVGRFNGRLKL